MEWKIDGSHKPSLFSPGDAIVNPARLFVAPRWSAEVEILLLGINPVFITRITEQMNRHNGLELLIPGFQFRDELLCLLVLSLIAEFVQEVPPNPVYTESLTYTLIAHLIRLYSVAGSKPLPANRGLSVYKLALLKHYINEHLSDVISLEALATVAQISPSYFMTLFKQSTGLSPHQYVMSQRVEKAKMLLTQTKLSIGEIAIQTGFADQSHLTRLMRRYTHLTPKMLRGDKKQACSCAESAKAELRT